MPESYIQLPPQSTGLKAHTFQRTIGANAVEDEAVIFGEQYLASYIVNAGPSIATLNSHGLQIMAGASLKVRIRRIEITPATAATTAARGAWGVYRLSTAGTGGAVLTSMNLDPADGAPGATCMQLPTVVGTAGTTSVGVMTANVWQTMPTSGVISPTCVIDYDRPRSKPLIIAAGVTNGVCIKNLVAIAAADININVWYDESNF